MTKIPFVKVESLKNDFIIIDEEVRVHWNAQRARTICERRLGVGADGLIVLGPASADGIKFRLFNADGSRAEWSGNGVRGTAAYLAAMNPRRGDFHLLTKAGCVRVAVERRKQGGIIAEFMRPCPPVSPVPAAQRRRLQRLSGRAIGERVRYVDAGNPHWVLPVRHFRFDWESVGRACQVLNPSTGGINFEVVRTHSRARIELRIFERGVGPTPSSGSGALAAVAACHDLGLVGDVVEVVSEGGSQRARVAADNGAITLSAHARIMMAGVWSEGR